MILSYLRLVEFPNDKVSKETIKSFLQNKNFLTKEYIIQNKQKDSLCSNIEYDYEYLIKIRFDTQELFQKILLNYIN